MKAKVDKMTEDQIKTGSSINRIREREKNAKFRARMLTGDLGKEDGAKPADEIKKNESQTIGKAEEEMEKSIDPRVMEDRAIIHLYKALRNNPPRMLKRMQNVDGDSDGQLNLTEFKLFLS